MNRNSVAQELHKDTYGPWLRVSCGGSTMQCHSQLHEINSFTCCSVPHSPFNWLLCGGRGISLFI